MITAPLRAAARRRRRPNDCLKLGPAWRSASSSPCAAGRSRGRSPARTPAPPTPAGCAGRLAAGEPAAGARRRAAHATSSSVTWDRTISRYVSQVRISSSWVPMPATSPVVEDDDPVGVEDRPDALGDDDHRRVAQLPPERRAQARVGPEVEGREAVVEDVDVGRFDERAGDREPLALAARDVGAALGDRRRRAARASRSRTRGPARCRARATGPRRSPPRRRSAGCWRSCRRTGTPSGGPSPIRRHRSWRSSSRTSTPSTSTAPPVAS